MDEKLRQWTVARQGQLLYSNVYAIFGFIKLLESYYCIVVTGAKKVACLHGHWIYTITEVKYIPLTYKMTATPDEVKYKAVLQGMDLCKEFYFSYTYDLTSTLQKNCTQPLVGGIVQAVDQFAWNSFALKPILDLLSMHLQDMSKDLDAAADEAGDSDDEDSGEGKGKGKGEREHDIKDNRRSASMDNLAVARSNMKGMLLKGSMATGRPVHDMIMGWVVPVTHGFIDERVFKLQDGPDLRFVLIARRSRKFAGTRYLRRGINSSGDAANEVESEQIYTRERLGGVHPYRSSSLVVVRGSIPFFWSHTNLYSPKPDVVIEPMEPTRVASRRLFGNLFSRYGNHVTCLNLVRMKKNKAEIPLGEGFRELCEELGGDSRARSGSMDASLSASGGLRMDHLGYPLAGTLPVDYIAYDFLHGKDQFATIDTIGREVFAKSGFFVQPSAMDVPGEDARERAYETTFGREWSTQLAEIILCARAQGSGAYRVREYLGAEGQGVMAGMLQRGVVRVNCVDCLDRTNVAQFTYAKLCAGMQIRALGIDLNGDILNRVLVEGMDCWAEHGDTMAMQYAGSEAMHKIDSAATNFSTGERVFVLTAGKRNALVAAKRYYSNVSTDFDRQHSMDLLLGILEPEKGTLPATVRPEELRLGEKGRRASDMNITVNWQALRSPTAHISLESDVPSTDDATKAADTVNPATRALLAYMPKMPLRVLEARFGLHFHSLHVRVPGALTSFSVVLNPSSEDVSNGGDGISDSAAAGVGDRPSGVSFSAPSSAAGVRALPWRLFPAQTWYQHSGGFSPALDVGDKDQDVAPLSATEQWYKNYVGMSGIVDEIKPYTRKGHKESPKQSRRARLDSQDMDVEVYNVPQHGKDDDLAEEPVWSPLTGIQLLCGHTGRDFDESIFDYDDDDEGIRQSFMTMDDEEGVGEERDRFETQDMSRGCGANTSTSSSRHRWSSADQRPTPRGSTIGATVNRLSMGAYRNVVDVAISNTRESHDAALPPPEKKASLFGSLFGGKKDKA